MAQLTHIIQSILAVGAVALLPLMILAMGLIFKMKFLQALKSGLLVGIGFQGLRLVVNFLVATLEPIINFYAAEEGSGFTIVDVGWETLSAAAWATKFAGLIVPLGLLLNFVLIRTKFIKTLNVDIWNYWHLIKSAAVLSFVLTFAGMSGKSNYVVSVIFGLFLSVLVCFVGDKIAPAWQSYFGLEGTTCTTILQLGTTLPIAVAINWILDKIPGVKKVDLSYDTINDKLGGLSDPTIIACILGAFLSIITRQSLTVTIQVAVGLAAVITLTPRMVKMFMEGISPLSTAARDYMIKRLGNDADFHIGVDIALGVGNQTAITVSALMIPISVFLAFALPFNHFFPLAFFGSSLTYAMATVTLVSRGNIFRSLIIGTVYMVFTYFAFNYTAALCTQFVESSGVLAIQDGVQVTAGGMNNFIEVILAFIQNMIK
ncbi:PTS transporter subunit IIC [Enterococcus sp. AZ072]|uniref:PTS transporter subunit IIC n=1 Tax=unclassified Enterococcus TaxID=2608891 RepID=UPI003D2B1897